MSLLIAALIAVATLASSGPATARAAVTVTVTEESYGADPLQVVTIKRNTSATAPGKTVIFIHGGGWNAGGRGSLDAEATEWAKTGWVVINMSYRLGKVEGDGRLILDDVATVLNTYRLRPYVDPARIVVYGESAGGHLAEWAGSYYGSKVAAYVAISPVSSISAAITAGQAPGAPDNVRNLGARAQLFFGYSVGTTDDHRYRDRVQSALIAGSSNEWVDLNIHGRPACTDLGSRCTLLEYPGTLHAGALIDANPQLAIDARHWADRQLT